MIQIWEIPQRTTDPLPCTLRLTVSRAVKILLPVSSQPPSHCQLPQALCLTPLLLVPAGSALNPAALSCLSAALPTCYELPLSHEPSSAAEVDAKDF